MAHSGSAVVYGADDRRDYYEVQEASLRRLFEATSVAFIRDYRIQSLLDGTLAGIPTWEELEQLCPGEPFAKQPAAAVCSGILMGEGLVLTSRHCFGDPDFTSIRVVFGYYLDGSKHLALTNQDVHEITSIEPSRENALDYAWVRFAGGTRQNRHPASVVSSPSPVIDGEPLLAVNSGGGVPLKLDQGGSVVDARQETQDYFLANIDAFRGASGSGVFNTDGELVGVVKSGSADFVRTRDGCRRTIRLSNAEAKEEVLYANRAIEGLCTVEPSESLCGALYEAPRRDHLAPENANAACAVSRVVDRKPSSGWGATGTIILAALAAARRRWKFDVSVLLGLLASARHQRY